MPAETPAPALTPPAHTLPAHGVAHLPVTLFASVMGLGGTALAWRRAARVWDVPEWPCQLFLAIAALAFLMVAGGYLAKWVRFPAVARAELRHPIRMAFVPTITIAILVLATAAQDVAPAVARVAWWVGALGHLAATVWALSSWTVRPDIGLSQVTPAWFIAVVGNVVSPLAAPTLGSVELGWFTFGVGILFWIALLPVVLSRVITHDQPLPPRLLPAYAIFIAPPSVALLSWHSLTGRLDDAPARVLYAAALMFVLLVAAQWRRLRDVPFGPSYWAYTFPLASVAAAAVAVSAELSGTAYDVVAVVLLAVVTVVVPAILVRTLVALSRRRLLVPEG